jgi:hypothetical protein
MDKQFAEFLGVCLLEKLVTKTATESITNLESIYIVRKHDNLIPSIFVVFDQELTGLELLWVHAV